MVEKAAKKSSSGILNDSLLLEKEIKKYHHKASIEINNFEYNELDVKIELSDFNSARVIIDERELEKMSSESFQFFKFKYESFISKHSNLARTEKIILNGEVLSSDVFVQFFQKSFGSSKIIKPYDNFIELLSRGIFANSPKIEKNNDVLPNELEIKIIFTSQQQNQEVLFSQTEVCKRFVPPTPDEKKGTSPPEEKKAPPLPDVKKEPPPPEEKKAPPLPDVKKVPPPPDEKKVPPPPPPEIKVPQVIKTLPKEKKPPPPPPIAVNPLNEESSPLIPLVCSSPAGPPVPPAPTITLTPTPLPIIIEGS